jgi:HSP20 family protein
MRYRHLGYRYALTVHAGAMGQAWGAVVVALAEPRWRPETDVYETRTAFHVTVELAGVDPDAVDVLLFDDALVIEGSRDLPAYDEEGWFRAVRIRQGPFRVEVPLPARVVADAVAARHRHGLLDITLPKAPEEG